VIFVGFWQRDDRDHVANADIDHHAQFVQDAGKRGTERDELDDLALADKLAAAVVSTLPMRVKIRRTLGA
jgi:hypothetical protein